LAGGGHRNGEPPGRLSQIPWPEPPPPPPPGRADGDNGVHGTHAAARGNAGNGDPLGNDAAAAATVAGKVDNAGQENNDRGGDDGGDNKNDNKWGRGA
jgi:hypothetical protein